MSSAAKKSTSMTMDCAVLDEARRLGINVSKAAERGVVEAIRAERARRWRDENAGATEDYNAFITSEGVPLVGLRML